MLKNTNVSACGRVLQLEDAPAGGLEGLGGWWFGGAGAVEAGFVFALAGVAEGFVEGAVGAFGGVGEDAGDDLFGFGVEGPVGAVAVGDGLRPFVVEFVDAPARAQRRLGDGLELRERHPAERLVGRERAPGVEHPLDLLFRGLRAGRHVRLPFCAPQGRTVGAFGLAVLCEARVCLAFRRGRVWKHAR